MKSLQSVVEEQLPLFDKKSMQSMEDDKFKVKFHWYALYPDEKSSSADIIKLLKSTLKLTPNKDYFTVYSDDKVQYDFKILLWNGENSIDSIVSGHKEIKSAKIIDWSKAKLSYLKSKHYRMNQYFVEFR